MDRRIAPVKVSPAIKCVRWSLLLSGIIYGMVKKSAFKRYEKGESVRRHKRILDRIERERREAVQKNTEIFTDMGKSFGVDVPPGWRFPF